MEERQLAKGSKRTFSESIKTIVQHQQIEHFRVHVQIQIKTATSKYFRKFSSVRNIQQTLFLTNKPTSKQANKQANEIKIKQLLSNV